MLIKRKSIEAQANHIDGPMSSAEEIKKNSKSKVKPNPNRTIKCAPITLSEQDGVRYLHFGTEWIQGAMRIRKPDAIELEYAQQMMAWMLFIDKPSKVLQLGLGTGALTKFCYRQFDDLTIDVAELNPDVINVCASMFNLPRNDARLNVMEVDAFDWVKQETNHNQYQAIQIDIYDATDKGPVLDSAEFYQACANCLSDEGILTVNLFGDHPSFKRNQKNLNSVFDQVIYLPQIHDGNVIAIAFKQSRNLDRKTLLERAKAIKLQYKLSAKKWVEAINLSVNFDIKQ